MASKAMWEVDPETRSKVRRSLSLCSPPNLAFASFPLYCGDSDGHGYTSPGIEHLAWYLASTGGLTTNWSILVGCSAKRVQEQCLLRLQCPLATVGIAKVWHLHLPELRRSPPRARRAHFLCPKHIHGRLQGQRD